MTRCTTAYLLSLSFVLGLSWMVRTASADAFGAEDLTLQTMTKRGLTESAIAYATAERKRSSDDPERFARWTQRLMECEAQAALRGQAGAEAHWQRSTELLTSFLREHPEHRRVPWIRWQATRCELLRTQSWLAQWLAAPAATALREQALESVRKMLRDLESLEDDVKQRQPLSSKQSPSGKQQAPPEQLANLRVDIVLLRCEALLVRSRLYPSDSRDRIGAATEVEKTAASILDRASQQWPTRDSLEVARAAAWLDLGKVDEALPVLQRVARNADDRLTRSRAATVAIESLLERGQISQAAAFVDLLKSMEPGPERFLAEIRLALADLQQIPKAQQEASMAKVIQASKTLGLQYGDYWRSRAEALIVGTSTTAAVDSTTGPDLVAVEVKQLLEAGNAKAAIEKLIQSSRNEQSLQHGVNAVRLGLLAALLLEKERLYRPAVDAIAGLAEEFADCSNAASAHLHAARIQSLALKAEPNDPANSQRYVELLTQQVLLWPDADETLEAIAWLKAWHSARGKLHSLASLFRQQAELCRQAATAGQSLDEWLNATLADHPHPEDEIAAFHEQRNAGKFKLVQARAATAELVASTLTRWPTAKQADQWRDQLKSLVQSHADDIDEPSVAAALLVLAVRAQDETLTTKLATQIETSGMLPETFYGFTKSLLDAIDALPGPQPPAWSSTVLAKAESWVGLEKSDHPLHRAVALRWRGFETTRSTTATHELAELAKQHPKNMALQLQLAHALAGSDLRQSSAIANQVALNVRGSKDPALFLQARWRVLRNQVRSGDTEAAQKAAALLLATLPSGSEIWESRLKAIAK